MKEEFKKLKGFPKLVIQIAMLSASMMALSFITETEFYTDWFCYVHDTTDKNLYKYGCKLDGTKTVHYHWNYRGWIYFLTGFAFFWVSVAKIIMSHKEEDFKKTLNE